MFQTAMLLFLFFLLPQDVAKPFEVIKPKNTGLDREVELVELRLENKLREQLGATERELSKKIAIELKEHREYLQNLDDGFFSRIQFWLPILATTVAILVAAFLWIVGKTRKEAFETALAIAVSKATELAQQRVSEIIIPDNIIESAKKVNEETILQIAELKTQLTAEVTHELKAARDDVVKNKHEIIEQTLDAAMKERFKDELDVLGRLESMEKQLELLEESNIHLSELWRSIYSSRNTPMVAAVPPSIGAAVSSASEASRRVMEYVIKRLM